MLSLVDVAPHRIHRIYLPAASLPAVVAAGEEADAGRLMRQPALESRLYPDVHLSTVADRPLAGEACFEAINPLSLLVFWRI